MSDGALFAIDDELAGADEYAADDPPKRRPDTVTFADWLDLVDADDVCVP